MESPPSYSTNSEAPLLSEDSGLFITSGSFSSDSASGWHQITSELQESDYDDRSLSLCESTETSERMCGDNFNTVKKGPGKIIATTLEPPPEFQDTPTQKNYGNPVFLQEDNTSSISESTYNLDRMTLGVSMSTNYVSPNSVDKNRPETLHDRRHCLNHRFSPRLLHLSPCRGNRPSSRNSLSSRLSSSHNSLVNQLQADDSSFITQAISHDVLTTNASDIPDMYNVPFDSDIYAVPIDMVKPNSYNLRHKGKKPQRNNKKRGKDVLQTLSISMSQDKNNKLSKDFNNMPSSKETKSKRHSLPGSSVRKSMAESDSDSLHMTLCEMRNYLHTLYSSSSDSESMSNGTLKNYNNTYLRHENKEFNSRLFVSENSDEFKNIESNNNHNKCNKNTFGMNIKNKKHKDNTASKDLIEGVKSKKSVVPSQAKLKSMPIRILTVNFKQSFCNLFRWRRQPTAENSGVEEISPSENAAPPVVRRALPPLPQSPQSSKRQGNEEEVVMDFATSIQRVKDYGWYWGPLSVEAAEKILSNEPDGSFIVRDSSDDHYIFTLTFKLNGLRHVRIEHDQGNFCFGGCTMFKAPSIVEFIDKAVETSRNGRYLFFLHLRPVLGPVRVQLLYPVSRFKRVQSLQHLCRFVILKFVRRDLISNLPLPRRLLDYLSSTHYYSEMLAEI